jgi:RecA-family ATPase
MTDWEDALSAAHHHDDSDESPLSPPLGPPYVSDDAASFAASSAAPTKTWYDDTFLTVKGISEQQDYEVEEGETLDSLGQKIHDAATGKRLGELKSQDIAVYTALTKYRDSLSPPPPPLPSGDPAPAFASPIEWFNMLGTEGAVAESVEKLCTDGYNANLVSMSGGGKTVFLLHLAHCLAIGPAASKLLFNLKIPEPRATLYIAAEDQRALKFRSMAAVQYHGMDPEQVYKYFSIVYEHTRHSIMTTEGQRALLDVVKKWGEECLRRGIRPGLVILDTQRQILGSGNTNEADVTSKMTLMMNKIQDALDKQVCVYTSVHTKKADPSTFSGSGEQLDSREISTLLERATNDGPGIIHLVKHKNYPTVGESTDPIGVYETAKNEWTSLPGLDPAVLSAYRPEDLQAYPVFVPTGGSDHVTSALAEIQEAREAGSDTKTDEEREEEKQRKAIQRTAALHTFLLEHPDPGVKHTALPKKGIFGAQPTLIATLVHRADLIAAVPPERRDEYTEWLMETFPAYKSGRTTVWVLHERWDEFCIWTRVDRNELIRAVEARKAEES